MSDPNTKYVQVTLEVPRDPDAYDYTLHSLEHLRYRHEPEVKDWIIDEVIEEGRCVGQNVAGGLKVEKPDDGEVFRFEKEVWSEGIHDWTVVVAINPAAFVDDEQHHDVITAFCGCHDEDEPSCDRGRTSTEART